MHTPGPWRRVALDDGEYFTHQIEITEGHVASIVGWSKQGRTCALTEANGRLIEHAPDMADALHRLLRWAGQMGGWEAPCWAHARTVLAHATNGPTHRPPDAFGDGVEPE